MSLQKYKNNSSFDLCSSSTANNGVNKLTNQVVVSNQLDNQQQAAIQDTSNHSNQIDELNETLNKSKTKKSSSFSSLSNLFKNRFKRAKSNHKLKSSKDTKNLMVRSISITFATDTSQKLSVSNLDSTAFSNDSSNKSTNLNESSRSTNDEQQQIKKSKLLHKLSEKLRTKFKFKNGKSNSLDDSKIDLDDSLESDVFNKSNSLNDSSTNEDKPQTDNYLKFINKYNQDLKLTNQSEHDSDSNLNSKRVRSNVKLRPKSEIFQGDPLQNNLKNHRFTTIEVMTIN